MVIISIVVFIHEFGHYLFARIFGVHVTDFAIGFGREICGFNDKNNMRWSFRMIPMGGYIKMYGDEQAASTPNREKMESMSDAEKKISFQYQTLWKKSMIAFAGPLFNILSAIITLVLLYSFYGEYGYYNSVGNVIANSKASENGIEVGDKIMKINDTEIETYFHIIETLGNPEITKFEITYLREGVTNSFMVNFEEGEERKIGIAFQSEFNGKTINFIDAIFKACIFVYDTIILTLESIYKIIIGTLSPENLSGPIGIAQYSLHSAQLGLGAVIWLMVVISINLGVINLLPIPILDGGHILYNILSAIFGERFAVKYQDWGYKVGFALLIFVFIFTIYNDIRKLFS